MMHVEFDVLPTMCAVLLLAPKMRVMALTPTLSNALLQYIYDNLPNACHHMINDNSRDFIHAIQAKSLQQFALIVQLIARIFFDGSRSGLIFIAVIK